MDVSPVTGVLAMRRRSAGFRPSKLTSSRVVLRTAIDCPMCLGNGQRRGGRNDLQNYREQDPGSLLSEGVHGRRREVVLDHVDKAS